MPHVCGRSGRELAAAGIVRNADYARHGRTYRLLAVVEARKTILELLLANHPLDCMTCDKMGDCKLADYAYRYGVTDSPFKGEKYGYALDESNPFISRDLNKCILCGACVRACEEMTGQDNLSSVSWLPP